MPEAREHLRRGERPGVDGRRRAIPVTQPQRPVLAGRGAADVADEDEPHGAAATDPRVRVVQRVRDRVGGGLGASQQRDPARTDAPSLAQITIPGSRDLLGVRPRGQLRVILDGDDHGGVSPTLARPRGRGAQVRIRHTPAHQPGRGGLGQPLGPAAGREEQAEDPWSAHHCDDITMEHHVASQVRSRYDAPPRAGDTVAGRSLLHGEQGSLAGALDVLAEAVEPFDGPTGLLGEWRITVASGVGDVIGVLCPQLAGRGPISDL